MIKSSIVKVVSLRVVYLRDENRSYLLNYFNRIY